MDIGLPDAAVAGFAGDDRGVVAGGVFVRVVGAVVDDEGPDVAVLIASPHDDDVGDGAQADPPFGADEDPVLAIAVRAGGEPDDVGAVIGLGQRESAELGAGGEVGQPALLLLVVAEQPDRGHRQAAVHGVEGAEASVAAGQLEGGQALGERAHAGAAVAGERAARHGEPGVGRDQFVRELGTLPVLRRRRIRRSSTNVRTRSRTARSSSVSRSSMP